MKPIIFVRVADMKYYQGITDNDIPANGGSYVNETGRAHECFNFSPVIREGEKNEICLGFFMLPGKASEELHIEKIPGCSLLKNEKEIKEVVVVFVSKANGSKTMRVVGFYKNATVYRHPQYMLIDDYYEQQYMFAAKKEDCVVLPYSTRFASSDWYVPSSTTKGNTFGFGRANVWYAGGEDASAEEIQFVDRMIHSIESYTGENWIEKEGK